MPDFSEGIITWSSECLSLYNQDVSDLSDLRADPGRAAEYGLGVQRLAAQVTDNDDNDD